jgi:hypothetical protein
MVAVGTYAPAGEMSVSSSRRCPHKPEPRRPGNRHSKETDVLILLPLLRCLSHRTRLAVGLALTTVGLFLIIAALAHGVISVIVGAIFILGAFGGRRAPTASRPARAPRAS